MTRSDQNKLGDIQIGLRASETSTEEQLDKVRKTIRDEQGASNASPSSAMHVSL